MKRTVWLVLTVLVASAASAADGVPASPCDIHYPSDDAIRWECRALGNNDSLESLFGDRWQDVARINRIDRRHAVPGTRIKVPVRLEDLEGFAPVPVELETGSPDRKTILVDLTEQFLGAYENGKLVFSTPIASGSSEYITPPGEFRITAFSRNHLSSMYLIENLDVPYPMHYGLQFLVNEQDVAYWIHGRDLPGHPASHGCIGLYDEEMQKDYYGAPEYPLLDSARRLYQWAIHPRQDDGQLHYLKNGPLVLIIGTPPGGSTGSPNPNPAPGP